MRIVILTAQTKNQEKSLKPIIHVCQKNGHKVFNGSHVLPKSTNEKAILTYINTVTKELIRADGIIVEASTSNFHLGRFMTFALQQHKPTLLLYTKQLPPEYIVGATRLVTSEKYSLTKTAELEATLKDFFKMVKKKKLTYRFNLMISRDINNYLMDKARGEGISKADYIRQLVTTDMTTTTE